MKFLQSVLFTLFCTAAFAVKSGDEKYALEAQGHFYVFVSGGILIVDPVSMSVVRNLTGSDFPTTWGDCVYSEVDSVHFMFAADRTYSKMWVIDTVTQTVIAKTPIGKIPVHIYAVESREEIWAHDDGEGNFEVINLNNVCETQAENLGQTDSMKHGKLVFEDDLNDTAWTTNTADPGVYKFNLSNMEPTVKGIFYNFTEQASTVLGSSSVCPGTHGIAYSSVSKHLYVECSGQGVWEFDTVSETLVAIYPSALGQTFATPDDEFVVVLNTNADAVHLFQATSNGVAAEQQADFTVSKPSRVAFTPTNQGSTLEGAELEDWTGWFSSASNASGLAYVDFEEVLTGNFSNNTAYTVDSGVVTSSTRYMKTGGEYVALTTDSPSRSIAFVNATSRELIGYVQVPESTTFFRIGWAPLRTTTTATACITPTPSTTPSTPAPTKAALTASANGLLMFVAIIFVILSFLA